MARKKKFTGYIMFAALMVLLVTAFIHGHMDHETFAHIHTATGIVFTLTLVYHLKLNWKAVLLYLGLRKKSAA